MFRLDCGWETATMTASASKRGRSRPLLRGIPSWFPRLAGGQDGKASDRASVPASAPRGRRRPSSSIATHFATIPLPVRGNASGASGGDRPQRSTGRDLGGFDTLFQNASPLPAWGSLSLVASLMRHGQHSDQHTLPRPTASGKRLRDLGIQFLQVPLNIRGVYARVLIDSGRLPCQLSHLPSRSNSPPYLKDRQCTARWPALGDKVPRSGSSNTASRRTRMLLSL
jgi:hypothetical protein